MIKALLCFFLVVAARADSIETSNKAIIYGNIKRMDLTQLVLIARFRTPNGEETKELEIPRDQIFKIEFNSTTFNSGSFSDGFLPPNENRSSNVSTGKTVAVLLGGERKACDGAIIDDQHHLKCGTNNFPRNVVIRLLLAAQ